MTNFTTAVYVDASPEAAFDAIVSPREWWGRDIEGDPAVAGATWTYRYKDMHWSRQKNAELIPGKRVVWEIEDSRMTFLKDQAEWKGTQLVFDIAAKNGKTEIRFTHEGLVPQVECFDICTNAWTGLIQDSLKDLVETGNGLPDTVEKDAA